MERVIDELDDILVDVAVSDEVGNKFWRLHLSGEAEVDWETFAERLSKFMGWNFSALDRDQNEKIRYLRFILGTRQKGAAKDSPPTKVSLEKFGQLLTWFGPMDKAGRWLENIHNVMKQEWFPWTFDF